MALVFGLAFTPGPLSRPPLFEAIVPTRDAPRPPEEEPTPSPPRRAGGESSPRLASPPEPAPPGRKADAAQVALPSPRLPPLVAPPPIPVAPVAGAGSARRAGGEDQDGAGTGAGGNGNGSGGGGAGGSGGDGADGNRNAALYPRQIAGKLHYAEIPKELRKARTGGVIRLRYRIGIDGRVSGCTVIVSSGMPEFDRDTCTRIDERFRFRPARDAAGHPISFVMTETHGWGTAGGEE